jgi:N-acetylneuraminate synthase/N,N'-diacetyllegionaminate synthase
MTTPAPYLIAEIGVNHDGDPERAAAMVHDAAAAGFDAVKFQHWIVDELLADTAPNAAYQGDGNQRALLADLTLTLDDLRALRRLARERRVAFVCTADGIRAHRDVMSLEPDALKIGSGDNDNPWLLDDVAAAALPVYLSTGMATTADVVAMVDRLRSVSHLVLLHCVTAYPTPIESASLQRLAELGAATDRPVGFSDHTLGIAAASAAIALGAPVVEKHVTWVDPAGLAHTPGPDHAASLSLVDAPAWVAELRAVARAVRCREPLAAEQENRRVVRKGLYARRDLPVGHRLTIDDLEPLRPVLDGVPAGSRDLVLGRALRNPLPRGAVLRPGDLAGRPA